MPASDSSDFNVTDSPILFHTIVDRDSVPPTPSNNRLAPSTPLTESDWVPARLDNFSSIAMFRKSFWLSVERLYFAALLAEDCDCKRHDFSVNRDELSQMGLRNEELKWLLMKNIIEEAEPSLHRKESEPSPARPVRFPASALFIITETGIELVEQRLSASTLRQTSELARERDNVSVSGQTEIKPSWDKERHELRFSGKVVKKFKWRAANQETILAAFEEEGWPAHIDDPLPQQTDIDPKRRLADAIKSLNRHQKFSLVRFCGDGTGEGVLWELT